MNRIAILLAACLGVAAVAHAETPTTGPATRPAAVPFTGTVDLVRGGTFRLAGIGTNDPQNPAWWAFDGTPVLPPKHTGTRRELPITLNPAARTRQMAWTRAEKAVSDRNVTLRIDTPGMLAESAGDDDSDCDPKTGLYTKFCRKVFQRYNDAATFVVRGSVDDEQWQTFAVFTPDGPKKAGPIAAEFDAEPDALATLSLKGAWDWPIRLVFVARDGEASDSTYGYAVKSPFGRSKSATSSVFRMNEIDRVYVQFCGQQRFEIRDLPTNAGPTTRPVTITDERLHPALEGLTPLAESPPQEIPAKRFYERLAAASQPATRPAGGN